ncbi:hypothetical protein CGL56_09570 [Neolewinella marina]|uniref:GNAT family N-acetyltransferase n=1 Tax=Neolewinella marina TaxID=438751 RepID=A0A2G0CFF9_9BACT|nr:hypothetical protein CGL56_09570 [Neolewinella marina]
MSGKPQIRRLSRPDIDLPRWNAAVRDSPANFPYGLSHWLDVATAGRWEGLVVDDYRLVLPLPALRRFGFLPVIIRPPYTQQLGPFGRPRPGDIAALLQAIPFRFQVSLPLIASIPAEEISSRFRCRKRTNYELDLSGEWAQIVSGFPRKLQAFLRQTAARDQLQPLEADEFVDLSRRHLAGRAGLRESDLTALHTLILAARQHEFGQCYQLREEGELLAAGFFPCFGRRTINLATVTTERGRKRRGTSRLLAQVMRQRAGTPGAIFDFEGSELPGVRDFFAKFGGSDRGYYLLESRPFGLG